MVSPLLVILFLIDLYFGRHQSEQLGWNTAFGNSVSLLWVCVLLARWLIDQYPTPDLFFTALRTNELLFGQALLVAVLFTWVLTMLVCNFFHVWPTGIAFLVSSAKSVNVVAYLAISAVVTDIPLDLATFFAALLVFIVFRFFLVLLMEAVPMTETAQRTVERRRRKEQRRKAGKKGARVKKWNTFKDRMQDRWEAFTEWFK